MSVQQVKVLQALNYALREGDYDSARDLVTKVLDVQDKKQAYAEISALACYQGNIFRMMEVDSFRGHSLDEEEIRRCCDKAIENKDIRNVVQCKRMLGENILANELRPLRESLGESVIPGYQSSRSYLIKFIRSRLGDTLTPEEVVRLRYIEIQIDRSDSD